MRAETKTSLDVTSSSSNVPQSQSQSRYEESVEESEGRKITRTLQQESRVLSQRHTTVVAASASGFPAVTPEGFDLDLLVASQGTFSADEFDVSDFDNGDDEDTATDILVAEELTDRKRAQMHAARIHAKHSLPPHPDSAHQGASQHSLPPQGASQQGFLDIPVMRRPRKVDSASVEEKQERRRSIKELVSSFEEQLNPFMVRRSHSHESLPAEGADKYSSQGVSMRDTAGSVPNLYK